MKTEPLTQRETVLMALYSAGSNGICGTSFLEMRIPRYPSRIHELRAEGYHISRRRCTNPYHKHRDGSVQYEWYLEAQELTAEAQTIPMF